MGDNSVFLEMKLVPKIPVLNVKASCRSGESYRKKTKFPAELVQKTKVQFMAAEVCDVAIHNARMCVLALLWKCHDTFMLNRIEGSRDASP